MGDIVETRAPHAGTPNDSTTSILLFDGDHRLVRNFEFHMASGYAEVPWSIVLRVAMTTECRCILIDQYAADGRAAVDRACILRTRRLVRSFRLLGLRLCDHVVRSDDSCFSFRAAGLL